MTVPSTDFEIGRGDNAPVLIWQLPFDVAGSVFELVVTTRTTSLTLRSDDGGLDLDDGPNSLTWEVTPEQSAALPTGKLTQYTLRRIVLGDGGEIRYYAAGWITAVDGPVSTTDPAIVMVRGVQGIPGEAASAEEIAKQSMIYSLIFG